MLSEFPAIRQSAFLVLILSAFGPLGHSQTDASNPSRRVVPARDKQQRLALVIGNNAYAQMPLRNSVNDAHGMAGVLNEAQFQVSVVENADARTLESAVQGFVGAIQPGDVALLYYSGHGFQIGGENYLAPVDFQASTETDAKFKAFPVTRILDSLQERGARLKIVILDACRDNPFRVTRSAASGLAPMTTGRGSFIAFATDPGRTADDNPAGANGLFTKHLIDAMREPGLKLDEVFNKTREAVEKDSAGKQIPWTISSVLGDFTFRLVAAPDTTRVEQTNVELVFWNSIKDSTDPLLYQAYLHKFPDGLFREIAEIKAKQPAMEKAGTSNTDANTSAGSASAVREFPVKHFHGLYLLPGNLTDAVEGRLWVGGGKAVFQERGSGAKPADNFSAGCSDIVEVVPRHYSSDLKINGTRVTITYYYFDLRIGKRTFTFWVLPSDHPNSVGVATGATASGPPAIEDNGRQSPDQTNEAASLIKKMCEPVWFQKQQ